MISKYIDNQIECKYKNDCKHYYPWNGGDVCSLCLICRNNIYKKKEKKSYYKQPISDTILEIVVAGIVITLLIALFL